MPSAWKGLGASRQSYEAVKAVCLDLVREISRTAAREPSDPRVLAAVEYIRQRVDQTILLADVAKAANLSPGRFRHLFVEETGMPLRTYVLWRRLLHVWTLLMQGETLVDGGPRCWICGLGAPVTDSTVDVRPCSVCTEHEWSAQCSLANATGSLGLNHRAG